MAASIYYNGWYNCISYNVSRATYKCRLNCKPSVFSSHLILILRGRVNTAGKIMLMQICSQGEEMSN